MMTQTDKDVMLFELIALLKRYYNFFLLCSHPMFRYISKLQIGTTQVMVNAYQVLTLRALRKLTNHCGKKIRKKHLWVDTDQVILG